MVKMIYIFDYIYKYAYYTHNYLDTISDIVRKIYILINDILNLYFQILYNNISYP